MVVDECPSQNPPKFSADINCDLRYTYVLLNDFFTAGNGVLMKKKLESKDLGIIKGRLYKKSL